MDAWDYVVREEEVPWQTMSVPIPLIGIGTDKTRAVLLA